MSEEDYGIQKILKLRKLTRAIADLLRGQLTDYLSTLTPMLRPRSILGEYIQGGTKETVRGSEKAFLQLQRLYTTVANTKPYSLLTELRSPIQIDSTAIEITPMEYAHVANGDGQSKKMTIVTPLKWAVTYSGFSPSKLEDLIANRNRMNEETYRFVLHYSVLHVVLNSYPGLPRMLEALRFPLSFERLPQFGELPVSCISSRVSTIRPPDNLIIESTEISGQATFEEVVSLDDLRNLEDPLKAQLAEIAKTHGEEFTAAS
jgi:hypothetical protein